MDVVAKRDLTAEAIGNDSKNFSPADAILRKEAKLAFESLGLPSTKSEEYRFTPITRTLEKEFSSLSPTNHKKSIGSVEKFLIPDLKANVLVFVNGIFAPEHSKIISSPDKLVVKQLSRAVSENISIISKHLGKKADATKNPFVALNSLNWSDGIFLHVPADTNVAEPVLLLHINDATTDNAIHHSRLLCIVEQGSELNMIGKFEGIGTQTTFSTLVEEIVVESEATLNYYKIQNDHGKAIQVSTTAVHQSDKSHVNTFTLTLDGQLIRNNLSIFIDGENCESHFHGLYLLTGHTLADNHTVVDHIKPNSFSNELYKGVMDGNAKGVFNGKIFVRPNAQKTNAFQSNRNVLLTETATINTKPQLEIWADDVKCSHGCTTGQLDEEAMFYLQSRGIGQETARAMLLYAFASEVIETIKDEKLKTYFDELIAERLHKNF